MRRLALALSLAAAVARGEPLQLGGFVDGNFAWDTAQPHSGAIAGLTTPARQGASVNLVTLDATVATPRLQLQLSVGAGAALDALAGATAWRHLVEASLAVPLGRGLSVEAGLFPADLGPETFPTWGNWNYSHAWMAELAPWYQAGVRLRWRITPRLAAQVAWLSGWDVPARDHRFTSGGGQVLWTSERLTAALTFYGGPRPGDGGARLFTTVWAQLAVTRFLAIAAAFDAGVDTGSGARATQAWYAGAVYARMRPAGFLAFTVRAELFDDADGGERSGTAQVLWSTTLTVDHLLGPVAVRLEGRLDRSGAVTLDGADTRGIVVAALTGRF